MELNTTTLSGRLGRDCEVKVVGATGAMTVVKFSIAYSKRVKINGNWEFKATWWDCEKHFFESNKSQLDYHVGKLLKGAEVVVIGELEKDEWTDKEGRQASKPKILCQKILFFPNSQGGEAKQESAPQNTRQGGSYQRNQPPKPPQQGELGFGESGDDGGNIPF